MTKSRAVFAGILCCAAACGSEPTVAVRIALVPGAAPAVRADVTSAVDPLPCMPGMTCLTPTELSVKITAAYVAEDIEAGTGTNVGATQAIYASPECDGIEGSSDGDAVQPQPNLGNCSIDVGLTSSSNPPQTITKSARYIDLAAGPAAVEAALDAGKFGVAPGTYRYLRLDIGSNAPAGQFNGSEDSLPAGTAMNFRFQAPGMPAPYEIRRLTGVDVAFPAPVELTEANEVDVDIEYTVTGVVLASPGTGPTPGDPGACTPPVGDPATRYCLEVSRIRFAPVITIR